MGFKVRITNSPNWAALRRDFSRGIQSAQRFMGEEIAGILRDEVVSRIPNRPGWFKLYRRSLRVEIDDAVPGNLRALVTADTSMFLGDVPADNTAVYVEGDSAVAFILKQYNPWTVDTLPSIRGGGRADLRTVPAGASETNQIRERLKDSIDDATRALVDAGYLVDPTGMPVYNGRTYFDFPFMAKRLEYGLGPFKPTPHWKPSVAKVRAQADRIVRDLAPAVEAALKDSL